MSYQRAITPVWVTLGFAWLIGQIYIVNYPFIPLIQRPVHLMLALAIAVLALPLDSRRLGAAVSRAVDLALFAGVVATAVYYVSSADRLTERMPGIDEIEVLDIGFGLFVIGVTLECVRRIVGWSLLGVIITFLIYGFFGNYFPGWLDFRGLELPEMIENLTMLADGLLGVTTSTSVQFVFYFVAFGAFYSAIGGSQLFIDIGLSAVGHHRGGAAKAAVVSSSMMGSISGSAVANVAATGVFTIPLMRRAGLSAERAAATEAVASTGGQLMPPIMGIAAFVMAELLQIDYGRIALAGIIPAVGFYVAIFLAVDLHARRSGIGTMSRTEIGEFKPIMPRLYLLIPPVALIGVLVAGYSATFAATVGILSCVPTAYLRRETWQSIRNWIDAVADAAKQAAQVAVPIAAIGIIISIAIQSNLALKFSTRLMDISGGNLIVAMVMIIIGCLIMGMGLPTVAAYIIGAILFVPALLKLGINEFSAHFFVMYYCVLSMITPPVALASYTAAGMAKANTMRASFLAFRISIVSFFIPFAFAFDPTLLGQGDLHWVAFAFLSLMVATAAWAVVVEGYFFGHLNVVERAVFAVGSMAAIFWPTGTLIWGVGIAVIVAAGFWRFKAGRRPVLALQGKGHEDA